MTNLQIQMSVVLSYNYLYIYIFLISSVIGSVVNIVVQMIGFYLTATSMKRVQYKGSSKGGGFGAGTTSCKRHEMSSIKNVWGGVG